MYRRYVKRSIDVILSLVGLILASWLFLLIMIAIEIDDPGPVFFSQKRVGIHKKYFQLYKFRSMKMSTPHDMPTHLLENPEQYITRVGKFLRKTSLDEIPQLWNILRGDMSVIGPRPALWNQEDLLAERDKYGANDVKPGLSGWAQICGRDELEGAATGRALITSDIPGCREAVEDGVSGYLCPAQDAEGLTRAMRDFAQQSFDRQVQMGQSGRALVERKFDKQLVVAKTLDGLGLPAAVRN